MCYSPGPGLCPSEDLWQDLKVNFIYAVLHEKN